MAPLLSCHLQFRQLFEQAMSSFVIGVCRSLTRCQDRGPSDCHNTQMKRFILELRGGRRQRERESVRKETFCEGKLSFAGQIQSNPLYLYIAHLNIYKGSNILHNKTDKLNGKIQKIKKNNIEKMKRNSAQNQCPK